MSCEAVEGDPPLTFTWSTTNPNNTMPSNTIISQVRRVLGFKLYICIFIHNSARYCRYRVLISRFYFIFWFFSTLCQSCG